MGLVLSGREVKDAWWYHHDAWIGWWSVLPRRRGRHSPSSPSKTMGGRMAGRYLYVWALVQPGKGREG